MNMLKIIDALNPLNVPIVRHLLRYHGVSRSRRILRGLRKGNARLAVEAPRRLQAPGCETFFGYYDISPLHGDGHRLLAHTVSGSMGSPNGHGPATVGFFDLDQDRFFNLGETSSWCSQMGARLRWYPSPKDEQIAFNTWTGTHHTTVIKELNVAGAIHRTPMALYDISRDGRFGLSLNFARLGWLRPGYGYADGGDPLNRDRCPSSDGIWLVEIGSERNQLAISLADLARIEPTADMAQSFHYVNHIAFSPSGNRFLFFHLWTSPPPATDQWSVRAFTANRDGSDICLLNSQGRSSHYTWRSEDEIVIFVQEGRHGRYLLYRDRVGLIGPLWPHLPVNDGHQSFSPDGRWLLTDTYPDRFFEQSLLLFAEKGEAWTLGRFRPEAAYYGDLRCDLHPRWDVSGRNVIFDSAHDKGRAIYVLNVDKFISPHRT